MIMRQTVQAQDQSGTAINTGRIDTPEGLSRACFVRRAGRAPLRDPCPQRPLPTEEALRAKLAKRRRRSAALLAWFTSYGLARLCSAWQAAPPPLCRIDSDDHSLLGAQNIDDEPDAVQTRWAFTTCSASHLRKEEAWIPRILGALSVLGLTPCRRIYHIDAETRR